MQLMGLCACCSNTTMPVGTCDPDAITRAPVEIEWAAAVDYTGGAQGAAIIEYWTNRDGGKYGGVVLKFSIKDEASSFKPTFRKTAEGVEVHIAGWCEASAMMTALSLFASQWLKENRDDGGAGR